MKAILVEKEAHAESKTFRAISKAECKMIALLRRARTLQNNCYGDRKKAALLVGNLRITASGLIK